MKKLLALFALIPGLVFAQSYPSPTFKTVTLNGVLTITPPANSTTQALNVLQTSPTSGGIAGPLFYNYVQITNSANVTSNPLPGAVGIYEQYFSGGANQTGDSIAMFIDQNHNAASSSGHDHIAFVAQEYTSVADTSGGQEYGTNFAVIAANGTNTTAIVGQETDMEIDTGATVPQRWAIRAVNQGANQASGVDDSAYSIANTTAGGAFKNGFLLSNTFGQAPINTAGNMFATDAAMTIAAWDYLPNLTVTGWIMNFPNYTVSGAGVVNAAGGYVGVASNALATAGNIGEEPTNTTSTVSMTTGTATNCTSQSFTAGDWEISGTIQFTPAGSTTVSYIASDISTISATFNGALGNSSQLATTFATGTPEMLPTPSVPEHFSSTTTVYLVGQANFGVSTMTCSGIIHGRRMH